MGPPWGAVGGMLVPRGWGGIPRGWYTVYPGTPVPPGPVPPRVPCLPWYGGSPPFPYRRTTGINNTVPGYGGYWEGMVLGVWGQEGEGGRGYTGIGS